MYICIGILYIDMVKGYLGKRPGLDTQRAASIRDHDTQSPLTYCFFVRKKEYIPYIIPTSSHIPEEIPGNTEYIPL